MTQNSHSTYQGCCYLTAINTIHDRTTHCRNRNMVNEIAQPVECWHWDFGIEDFSLIKRMHKIQSQHWKCKNNYSPPIIKTLYIRYVKIVCSIYEPCTCNIMFCRVLRSLSCSRWTNRWMHGQTHWQKVMTMTNAFDSSVLRASK